MKVQVAGCFLAYLTSYMIVASPAAFPQFDQRPIKYCDRSASDGTGWVFHCNPGTPNPSRQNPSCRDLTSCFQTGCDCCSECSKSTTFSKFHILEINPTAVVL